ncbi:helix-loop-helix DNA-binding domain-containing protein [Hyaloraphidium curvatum]|nr:helix-loop-helix DNA-binding domain-containing protein [Hyaloraphidium curvatum]
MPTAISGTARAKPIAFPSVHRASFASSVPSGSYGSLGDFDEGGSSLERGTSSTKKNDSASKRRRRESHNAVERRRRDTINLQIQELCDLLPLDLVPTVGPGQAPGSKPNKGAVLRRGVDYIRMLQGDKRRLEERCRELEERLAELGVSSAAGEGDTEMGDGEEDKGRGNG